MSIYANTRLIVIDMDLKDNITTLTTYYLKYEEIMNIMRMVDWIGTELNFEVVVVCQ
jgi:hypothetical protein